MIGARDSAWEKGKIMRGFKFKYIVELFDIDTARKLDNLFLNDDIFTFCSWVCYSSICIYTYHDRSWSQEMSIQKQPLHAITTQNTLAELARALRKKKKTLAGMEMCGWTRSSTMNHLCGNVYSCWFQPLWTILVGWDSFSTYGKIKHVPNHQPVNNYNFPLVE